jgi:flagellin
MTRINTNLSSLTAQNALASSNSQLDTSLTRLSTGLQINSGKDNPAGLIASTVLQSEITTIGQALTNTQQANDIVSTADAALAEVSSRLNDIYGLVQASANKGALSSSEIAANQQQVDTSLQSIQRLAQTTVFAGSKLLNGSDAFNVNATGGNLNNFQSTSDITINSFNPALHTATPGDDVTIGVTHAATQATTTLAAGAGLANTLNNLTSTSTRTVTTLKGDDLTAGTGTGALNDLSTNSTHATQTIKGTKGGGAGGLDQLASGGGANTITLTVTGDLGSFQTAAINVAALQADSSVVTNAINAITNKTGVIASGTGAGADVTLTSTFVGAGTSTTPSVTFAASAGAGEVTKATAAETAGTTTAGTTGAATPTVFTITGNKGHTNITLANNDTLINGTNANLTAFAAQINGVTATTGVKATVVADTTNPLTNDLVLTSGNVGSAGVATLAVATGGNAGDTTAVGNAATTVAGTNGATANTTTIQLIGNLGRSVITVNNDQVINDSNALVNAINAVTNDTGIVASTTGSGAQPGSAITLTSQTYGSAATITANAIGATQVGDIATFNGTETQVAGTDAAGTVTTSAGSGAFTAVGNVITYTDNNISLTANTDPTLGTGTNNFDVTGGALFQIGPTVAYSNQVNVNLQGLDLSTLGRNFSTTANNSLNDLLSGGSQQLSSSDLTTASTIVSQAISQIATLRGQLGALQSDVFNSSTNSLQAALTQVTSAQSDITDTNFASETANLTRAQILVQAGTSVLSIANSRPQSILALLPKG